MSILNYFFIGAGFTFIVDLLLNIPTIRKRLKPQTLKWGGSERITCIIFWPIAILIFSRAFIKQSFK